MKTCSLREMITALEPDPKYQLTSTRELIRRFRWQTGQIGAGALSCRQLQRTMGTQSLRNSVKAIDDIHPPETIKQAFSKLEFPLGKGTTLLPTGAISLREMANRISGDKTVRINFLSYNTYLLPGLELPFGRWLDDAVGWDALAWFGIPFGGALLTLLGIATPGSIAIAEVLKLAGFTPSKVILTLSGIDLNSIQIKPKPALNARAELLGPVVANYDVCCLCEVFTEDSRQQVIRSLGEEWTHRAGPDESGEWTFGSSGLFFLAKKWPISKTEQHIFSNRGSKTKDSDAWANKGIMLNVLDVGFGQLELYQTHFYYGGGIPGRPEPSTEERMQVWKSELEELVSFYKRHHQAQNIAIITGDFNMNGADIRQYVLLRNIMDGLNMQDLWAWDVFRHDLSAGYTCRYTDGEESGWQRLFSETCPVDDTNGDKTLKSFCREYQYQNIPSKQIGRYDYIFIENPTNEHQIKLDISRPVRRPFPLHASIDGEEYLSDHLGLEVTIFINPV